VVVHELAPVLRMDAQERDKTLAAEPVRQMPELRERREDRPLVDEGPGAMHGTCFLHCPCSQGAVCV
jgi:hypothetical protein